MDDDITSPGSGSSTPLNMRWATATVVSAGRPTMLSRKFLLRSTPASGA